MKGFAIDVDTGEPRMGVAVRLSHRKTSGTVWARTGGLRGDLAGEELGNGAGMGGVMVLGKEKGGWVVGWGVWCGKRGEWSGRRWLDSEDF
jgi:hypothetical protein